MSEIPMPGDYGQAPQPTPEKQGFCSSVCEWSCKALGACCVCVVLIFFVIMMIILNSFSMFGYP